MPTQTGVIGPCALQETADDTALLGAVQKESQPDSKSEDFTEEGDLGFRAQQRKAENNAACATTKSDQTVTDTDIESPLEILSRGDCIKLIGELQQKIDNLETENQTLHKTVAQQLNKITDLESKLLTAGLNQTI